MQFCQKHWDALRQAVIDRGMYHLVAKSGEEAASNTLDDLDGVASLQSWDPLMSAHWNIASKVMASVGLAAMAEGFCPLCAVQKSYDWWDTPAAAPDGPRPPEAKDAQAWIDSCMDAMLAFAIEQGLMTPGPKPDVVP